MIETDLLHYAGMIVIEPFHHEEMIATAVVGVQREAAVQIEVISVIVMDQEDETTGKRDGIATTEIETDIVIAIATETVTIAIVGKDSKIVSESFIGDSIALVKKGGDVTAIGLDMIATIGPAFMYAAADKFRACPIIAAPRINMRISMVERLLLPAPNQLEHKLCNMHYQVGT